MCEGKPKRELALMTGNVLVHVTVTTMRSANMSDNRAAIVTVSVSVLRGCHIRVTHVCRECYRNSHGPETDNVRTPGLLKGRSYKWAGKAA